MSKFHEDWAKNGSSRLFTCFHYIHIKKTAPPPGGHVFSMITTIFRLLRDNHITNAKNVTSRVKKTPPPPGSYVIYRSKPLSNSTCGLETNVLTKFHEDWAN
ncbi:hypothetical protein DPMN_046180 [Dreissena polymorpha]|uniref:Uncharacterized protein n=1 Tax=Dreissena polymorpha TaxID=45954 RepID=A0A9D4D7F0_DREPO|nr:hypothetical protein DPMN_046180 [Dreissena polymorpha]